MMPKEKLHIHFKNKGNVSETGRGLGSHEEQAIRQFSSKYLFNNAYRHVLWFSNIKDILKVADSRLQQNNAHIFGKWERFRINKTKF